MISQCRIKQTAACRKDQSASVWIYLELRRFAKQTNGMAAAPRTNHSSTNLTSELVEACHEWTIQHITFRLKDTQPICSSVFKVSDVTSWSWQCLMRRQVDRVIEFGLRLNHLNDSLVRPHLRIPAEFTFTVHNPIGNNIFLGPNYGVFEENTIVYCKNSFFKDTELCKYTMVHDTLEIVCRVRELLSTTPTAFPIPPCQLNHDLEAILNDQQYTDVTLIVEGQTIKAHKAVLSARSPVFAAMFSSEMLEQRQNQVIIPDMEFKVAQHLLQFIYAGKTQIAPTMADALLVAADKYGLMRLKVQCEEAISGATAVSTATKTLVFADRTNAEHLKAHTMAFIKANMAKVMESDEWKTMVLEHPALLVGLFCNLTIK